MAIRKFSDITNETATKYDRFKETQVKATIEERFDTGSINTNPYDDAIQFLKEKLEDVIDENNDKIVDKQPVFVDTTQTLTGAKFFGTSTKLHFRDSGIYLNSNTDGTLQIVADDRVNIYGKANFVNSAITSSGNISASGDIILGQNLYFNGDETRLRSLSSYLGFFASGGGAKEIKAKSLTLSNDFSDSAPTNGLFVKGDAIIQGTLTAQEFNTEFVSSSIIFESGSTKFGDTSDDTHDFTGSINLQVSESSKGITINTVTGTQVGKLYNGNSNTFPVGNLSLNYGSNSTGLLTGQSNGLKIRGGSSSGGKIIFTSFTDEIMRMNNTGLGIGTDSPSEKLQVEGNISASGRIDLKEGSSNSAGQGVRFRGRNDLGLFEYGYNLQLAAPNDVVIMIDSNNNDNVQKFEIRKHSSAVNGGTEVLSVTQDGDLTTTGNITASGNISASGTITANSMVIAGTTVDGGAGLTVKSRFVVDAPDGSDWFSVGKISSGVVAFNSQGGNTQAGGVDLGARFNIQAISDSIPALAVRGKNGSSDLVRVSSYNTTTGDYLNIKNDGKIGIGTTSPDDKLHVNIGTADNAARFESTDTISRIQIKDSDDSAYFGTQNNKAFMGMDGNATSGNNITVDASGNTNVGGHITASGNISASGTGSFSDGRFTGRVGINRDEPLMALHVVGSTYVNQGSIFIDSGNRIKWGNSQQFIEGTNDSSLELGAGGSTQVFITGSGNVGIGTTSPGEKLEVRDGNLIVSSSTSEIVLGTVSGKSRIFTNSSKDIRISTATTNDVLFLKNSNGNVGIGTTSPTEKLHIVGDLKVQTNADAGVIHFGDTSDQTKIAGYDGSDSNPRIDFFTDDGSKRATIGTQLTVYGNISASGDITANAFIGDGSSLTNLPSQTDNNFTTTLKNKLDGIEASADVTDTANVTAAGALMDSELTNLAAVKAINQSLVTTADVTFGSVSISNGKIEFNSNTDVDTGTETIATATGADAAFFDYVVKNGTNVRAGTITAITDGTNVEFNEVSTVDLGDTRGVKLSVVLSSSNLLLKATVTSDNWNIQSFVRQIEL